MTSRDPGPPDALSAGDQLAGPGDPVADGPVARLHGVGVVRGGTTLLDDVDLVVHPGRPVAILGPNGAGKTTLLRVLSTHLFPTRGTVEVLGARFGRTDLRTLRSRVALSSVAMTPLLPMTHTAEALIAAARGGTLRLGGAMDPSDRAAARDALGRAGARHLAERSVRTLSQGEWQRVQLARALVGGPDLLLLDEPFAGLDLGGREALVADLDDVLTRPDAPAVVMVAHHLEEFPTAVRDALLLRDGRVVAAGAIAESVTDETVSTTFGLPVVVHRDGGRLTARVRR